MNLLFARPYNTEITGFYFTSYDDYLIKSAGLTDSFDQPVEEVEIELIDGDLAQLFEACKITQATLSVWFDEIEHLDSAEQVELYYRCRTLGQDVEQALNSLNTDGIIYASSVAEYARSYVTQSGILDKLPEALQCYFDYELLARDLEMSGSMSEFRYLGHCYTATGF
ncbi:MAG: antirestriction protein ArdA [Candidatus Thiodiazotropha endolucinida]|nr:antirestriction protein ArdA [Candidatus Thiodiazotropha taylori]MCW4261085.1 antirestriction protein ArdA [Candidatus Thiodiazotropha endolucinida]MCG8102349.1 antirestriction protein ArdA [Candidatus Thiodiazotropha taylori]MCG8120677.1 antirestriction protein ArdA [Candidatus Thiodiazotropha taylori]MCW4287672.1 antirestriction protein ArdA [Candidatus Thiodiazotropha endolucinida]